MNKQGGLMNKCVLLSIRPQWCELICNGKKTIEVRKTRPKLETPFKCYIYCTKADYYTWDAKAQNVPIWFGEKYTGKVIGEFVCDDIITDLRGENTDILCNSGCLVFDDLKKYGGNNPLYGWHISDLQIYDKPRELSEFYHYLPDKILDSGDYDCRGGGEVVCMDMPEGGDDCAECPYGGRVYLKRSPQSWCYVEEYDGKR